MQICICDAVRRKGVWGDGCGALEGMLKHTPSESVFLEGSYAQLCVQ